MPGEEPIRRPFADTAQRDEPRLHLLVGQRGERAALAFAFPTRERLALASEDELLALGFSGRKAEYVLVGSFVSWAVALVFVPLL